MGTGIFKERTIKKKRSFMLNLDKYKVEKDNGIESKRH